MKLSDTPTQLTYKRGERRRPELSKTNCAFFGHKGVGLVSTHSMWKSVRSKGEGETLIGLKVLVQIDFRLRERGAEECDRTGARRTAEKKPQNTFLLQRASRSNVDNEKGFSM